MIDKNFQMHPTHMTISHNLRCKSMFENRSIHKFSEVNFDGKNTQRLYCQLDTPVTVLNTGGCVHI